MKTLFLSLFLSFLFSNALYSETHSSNQENDQKKVILLKSRGSYPSTRAPYSFPVSVLQDESELEILFLENVGVVIMVINDDFGNVIYRESVDSSVRNLINIDFSSYCSENFLISFICENIILYGSFKN